MPGLHRQLAGLPPPPPRRRATPPSRPRSADVEAVDLRHVRQLGGLGEDGGLDLAVDGHHVDDGALGVAVRDHARLRVEGGGWCRVGVGRLGGDGEGCSGGGAPGC